jgi:hypothetical protein
MSDMDERRRMKDDVDAMASPGQNPVESDMDRYLTNKASAFRYPPTPDISAAVRNKLVEGSYRDSGRVTRKQTAYKPRRAWVTMALTAVVIITSLLTVPSVRAFVTDVYIGVVHIVRGVDPPDRNVPTVTPLNEWNPHLAGEIDLGAAYKYSTAIKLPTYPTDLGLPDHVYFQSGSSVLLYVWLDPNDSSRARLVLYQIPPSANIDKSVPENVASQSFYFDAVSKTHGFWIEGPSSFALQYVDENENRIVKSDQLLPGNTLIWDDMETTYIYKLVGEPVKTEAVKIAMSLKSLSPVPTPMPTATPVSPASHLDLYGPTNLYQLEKYTGFRVKIPALTELPELIQPDRTYMQGSVERPDSYENVIMVWFLPDRPDDIRMVLTQGMGDSTLGIDGTTGAVQVTVNGNPARWEQAPQNVYVEGPGGEQVLAERSFVTGSYALIWQDSNLHYRLETTLPVMQAIKIAEALK